MTKFLTAVAIISLAATATSGCATRRYVRNRTDPISQQVGELDKRTSENARNIGQLDEKTQRDIARVDEEAKTADAHAGDASKRADDALAKGSEAGQKADAARTVAENSLTRTGELQKYVENLDNYRVSASKTVYFGFDKSVLTDDTKKDLDELAQTLSGASRYVVEVQGFTDTAGSNEYNYALSEKRANAVVRYLTERHNIPVYRIHTIGLGKDVPAAGTNPREARKMSRRVEVKVYTPQDLPRTAEQGTASQPMTAQSSPAGSPQR
jgi:OOP family OmpA-OmpF porin